MRIGESIEFPLPMAGLGRLRNAQETQVKTQFSWKKATGFPQS